MKDALRRRIDTFLARHTTLALATRDSNGDPWVTPVFFAHDSNLTCYFLSSDSSRHARNLVPGAVAAVTVYADQQEWRSITGIQMRVIGNRVPPSEANRAAGLYAGKFPFVADKPAMQGASPPELAEALDKSTFWQLRPLWVRLIDNTLGFGHKDEAAWP